MNSQSYYGTTLTRRFYEESVPKIDLFSFVNKVAERLFKRLKIAILPNGYRYTDVNYWQVLVWREMLQLSTSEAADDVNEELIEHSRKGRGRKRYEHRLIGGTWPRHERMAPHGSQVDTFLRNMPPGIKNRLQQTIIKAELDLARELGIITNEISVYFDFTKDNFYGMDVFPDNPCITNIHDGRGTNKARKHAAMMIASGSTWLFAGLVLTKPGLGKELYVGTMIQRLVDWGYILKDTFGDREVSTFDVIATMDNKGLSYTGTMKHTPTVKKVVDEFLRGSCQSVVQHVLQRNPTCRVKHGPIPTHLILKVDPGTRARDLRRKLASGAISIKEARVHVHVFITTKPAPARKDQLVRWGMRIAQEFRKRWRIETGFRDYELFSPTSHARNNATKTFLHAFDMIAFNAWKIQQALCKKARHAPASKRRGPTLRRFCRKMAKEHVRGKNSASELLELAISSVIARI